MKISPLARKVGYVLFFLIYCMDTLCPSILLPLFPTIAVTLKVSRVELHQSLAYLSLGIFFSQLTIGLNIRNIGYRNAFFILFSLLELGAAITFFSTRIETFFIGEFLQGFGIGAAFPGINGLANIYEKPRVARIMRVIGTPACLLFFFGPLIGAYFAEAWNNAMYIILAIGGVMLILPIFFPSSSNVEVKKISEQLIYLFKNKAYLCYVAIMALNSASFYAFLAWSPFILINQLHLTSHQYAYATLVPILSLCLGSYSNILFGQRYYLAMIIIGFTSFAAGISLIFLMYIKLFDAWSFILMCSIFCYGYGLRLIDTKLGILSVVHKDYSPSAMAFSSIMLNLFTASALFVLSYIKIISDHVLLSLCFLTSGLAILLILKGSKKFLQ